MKTCTKCGINKEFCDFRYRKDREVYYSQCKECEKKYKKKQYNNNLVYNKEYRKKYYQENKENIISNVINYQKLNGSWMKKYNSNPLFKLNHNIRCRIRKFLKIRNFYKKSRTSEIIGCSQSELRIFLEQKFQPEMSWENYGDWHIDHIIPLSSAKTEEEIYELCHYTNLQPLWAQDNLIKSNKIF